MLVMDDRPHCKSDVRIPSYRLDALETTPQPTQEPCLLGLDDAADPVAAIETTTDTEVGIIFRHSGWMPRRRCVTQALKGIEDGENRTARFLGCGRNCWVLRSTLDRDVYRLSCDRCKDRFCEPCARERARHIASCVGEFAKGRELRLITLTLRKSDRTLSGDVDFLYQSFVRLRRRKLWSRGQRGGVYFVEIKRRRNDDGWHVHLHVLADGTYISKQKLSEAWHTITGGSFIVDVRYCHSGDDAARYVAKYAGKGVHGDCYRDSDMLLEAILALKGRRLVGKYGTWRDLTFDNDMEPGEWVGVDSLRRLFDRRSQGDPEATSIIAILMGVASCSTSNPNQHVRGP